MAKTYIFVDAVDSDFEFDEGGQFYINTNGEQVYISKTAVVTRLDRGTNNIMMMQAEIAELKELLRRNTK